MKVTKSYLSFRLVQNKSTIGENRTEELIGRFKNLGPVVQNFVVACCCIVVFYVHGKHLRSCRDGQVT